MIRYGPAGIPLSCKGRTLKDGIEDVHNLCLTALEVQLVRPRTLPRPADEEFEVGKTLATLGPEAEFVIGIDREGEIIYDRDVPIFEDDDLIQILTPPAPTFNDLEKLGKVARRHDVALSSHTPYYMDLTGSPDADGPEATLTIQYIDILQQAGLITDALGGDVVVTNLGLYDDRVRTREESNENILNNLATVMDMWQTYGLRPKLGVEITGQSDIFGSTEQVFELCDQIEGLIPVLNFAYYQSRTGGALQTASDFSDIIYKFAEESKGRVWAELSNIEIDPINCCEKVLTPLKKGDLKFERLAEALAETMPEITIISNSPLLEHDAVYMRTLTERVQSKKAAKALKEKKKEQEQLELEQQAKEKAPESDEPAPKSEE